MSVLTNQYSITPKIASKKSTIIPSPIYFNNKTSSLTCQLTKAQPRKLIQHSPNCALLCIAYIFIYAPTNARTAAFVAALDAI